MPPTAEVVRQAPFPLYGLGPDWTGYRAPLAAEVSGGEVTHVALGHGGTGGPGLTVATLHGDERASHLSPALAARHLSVDRHEGRWRPVPIPVEGREQVFWFREVGERWAAFARVGPVRVVVAANGWGLGDVRLAVADRTSYLTGASSTTSR